MIRRILFFLALTLLILGPDAQAAAKKQKVTFPSWDGTAISGILFRPQDAKPVPAIIAMHGCGGLFKAKRRVLLPAREDWAQRFVRAGYAVLFPDSYSPRQVRTTCNSKYSNAKIKLRHQVRDLIGAATWLVNQPFIDSSQIAIIGWGSGGTAVLRVLAPRFLKIRLLGIKAALAIYPNCVWLERATNFQPSPPPLILMGAADDWVSPAHCTALSQRWGSPITLYPGAYHGFDAPNKRVRIRKTGAGRIHVGTNSSARKKAIKAVMGRIEQSFATTAVPAAKNN